MAKEILSQSRLKEFFHYNPETGFFTRIKSISGRGVVGAIAGHNDGKGYVSIGIGGRKYGAHRLAWLYVFGEFPKEALDHRNRIRDDNRIENLREAPCSINQRNILVANSNGSTGFRGVVRHGKFFKAKITIGTFKTEQEAHEAYVAAKKLIHADSFSF